MADTTLIARYAQDTCGEVELCPACLHPVLPSATFCQVCDAPVSRYAGMLPYASIYALAWTYGRAMTTAAPRSLHATVPGLLLAADVATLALIAYLGGRLPFGVRPADLGSVGPALLVVFLRGAIFVRARRNLQRRRAEEAVG